MLRRTLQALAICFALGAVPTVASAQSAQEILARFDNEPTVLEVQQAAMAYAGLDPESISGWITRANVAPILPDLAEYEFRFRTQEDTLERFDADIDPATNNVIAQENREDLDEREQVWHKVRVRFDLRELIFNRDIISAGREVGRQAKLREDMLTTVTKLYYERRRAQVRMILNPPGDAADRLRMELTIQELTADIDAMTGAWFSNALVQAGQDPY